MKLKDHVCMIKTKWRDIILNWCENEGKEHWDLIEKTYQFDADRYNGFLFILPPSNNIFSCFNLIEPDNVNVVILGQDPYHGLNQATGLCFGVENNIIKPPSLRNIEKELIDDIGKSIENKRLDHWASQGVLMLNSALTVLQNTPGKYLKVWKPFTEFIINYCNNMERKIIFVAWGAFAYDKLKGIDETKHMLLVSSHPSPFSYKRNFKTFPPFSGSKPFSKINAQLENIRKPNIKW